MIGIAHTSPVVISILLDRSRFMSQTINPDEVSTWRHKVSEFRRAPKDGRERIVFVDQVATLQALLKDGASFDDIKVAVYDSLEVLKKIDGIKIIDSDEVQIDDNTPTEVLYRLLPDSLSTAIASADPGVDDSVISIDFSTPLPELSQDPDKKPRGKKPKPVREPEPDLDSEQEPARADPELPITEVMDDPENIEDDDEDQQTAPEPEPKPKANAKGKSKGKKKTSKKKTSKKTKAVTNKRLFG
jgi:hypothetical protein